MSARAAAVAALLAAAFACAPQPAEDPSKHDQDETVLIGSKSFTESVVLGEIAAGLLRSQGLPVEHRREIGGTRLLFEQLRTGGLDLYPEYTGTLREEIFAGRALPTGEALRRALADLGLGMTPPLGFNNTYALGMQEARAAELGIERISDLRRHPGLRFRFSNEFMSRGDGWEVLRRAYGLPQRDVRGVEHALAYRALEAGAADAIDLYSTDAEIAYYDLRVLEDDRGFFPRYDAVFLYREALRQRAPDAVAALARLGGRISDERMRAMNARARPPAGAPREEEARIAADFLARELGLRGARQPRRAGIAARVAADTADHLRLSGLSLLAAITVSVPLGILCARRRRLAQAVIGAVGVIQTVPAIALLVVLIAPVHRVGQALGTRDTAELTAMVALFLYSLLPVVRNTFAGLAGIPPALQEAALALGLPAGTRLLRVELPLASPMILAGIKTAAVLNVGFATLGGFIGAGGLGQPIFTGIRLDDTRLILQGAVPAALLALAVQGAFDLLERVIVPRGLRLRVEAAGGGP